MKSTNRKFNITDLFFAAADSFPYKKAIITKSKYISYTQLAQEVKETAAYFREEGIKEGDRVLVFVPMSIDLYRVVLSLFYMGATAVFLDEWVNKERFLLCCKLANCHGFIGNWKGKMFGFSSKEIRKIPIKLQLHKRISKTFKAQQVTPNRSALITYTTGSTGSPKAANRSHAFLGHQFRILKEKLNCQPEDVDMTMLPIVLFLNLGVGATSVIADYNSRKPEKIKPRKIFYQLHQHRVTRLTSSPYVVKRMAQYSIDIPTQQKHFLENIYTGGAAVFPDEAQLYNKAFPNTAITVIYGSTEAEPISSITAEDLVTNRAALTQGLPVGKVHPSVQLRIIPVDWNQHEVLPIKLAQSQLAAEDIGEIIVAGDHVLKSYYNNEHAFRDNKIIEGQTIWHRTGDSGYLKDGQLYLTGRCKQLIQKDGRFLSPFIIENRLQQLAGISAGTIMQKKGKTYLILETSNDANNIIKQLSDIDYDALVCLSNIPRDPRHHSKIDYEKLNMIAY